MSPIACLAKAWTRQTSHSDSLYSKGQVAVLVLGLSSEEFKGPGRRFDERVGIPAVEFT